MVVFGVCSLFTNMIFAQDVLVGWTFPATSADAIADQTITLNSGRFISCEHGIQGLPGYHVVAIDYTTDGSQVPTITDDKCAQVTGVNDGVDSVFWMIKCKTTGYGNLKLYSKQWSSNSPAGPRDFKVQYKFSGATVWNDLAIVTVGNDWTTGVVNGIDLPSTCNNLASNISFRWVMSSNTDISGGTVGATGTTKIDDISITGTVLSGIEMNETNNAVSIYPNPNRGSFNIENNSENKSLKVFNVLGKCVYEKNITANEKLNISDFSTGIYLINLTNSDNDQYSYKIVVE